MFREGSKLMETWEYIKLKGAVGKNAPNYYDDVLTVQCRLNHWIYKGLLPKIEFLAVDGDCGQKTKVAIGAFQFIIMGHKNPDCRVDPGGKTLQAMYQSLITPLTEKEKELAKWLMDQKSNPTATKKTKPNWNVSDEEFAKIQKAWGSELAQWATIPPVDDVDTKEFAPTYAIRDKYETVFAWKSDVPKEKCYASPRDRLQVLAMLRSDRAFWEQKMGDNRVGIEMLTYSSACAIKDYRDYIINRKMCPPTAKHRLEQVNKDVIYQMFIGMFQLMSPVGTPTAYANHGSAVAGFIKALISHSQDKEGKPIYKHF